MHNETLTARKALADAIRARASSDVWVNREARTAYQVEVRSALGGLMQGLHIAEITDLDHALQGERRSTARQYSVYPWRTRVRVVEWDAPLPGRADYGHGTEQKTAARWADPSEVRAVAARLAASETRP